MTSKIVPKHNPIVVEAFKHTITYKDSLVIKWLVYKPYSFAEQFPILKHQDVICIPLGLENNFQTGSLIDSETLEFFKN